MATTFRTGVPAELADRIPAGGLSWIIERAGRGVGYLVLSVVDSTEERARKAYVSGLFIDPEERGKGLGALALRFAGDVGRTLGLTIYSAAATGENKLPQLAGR